MLERYERRNNTVVRIAELGWNPIPSRVVAKASELSSTQY